MFVIGTDTFLISPLIPKLQTLFHLSTDVSGWMMGAYAFGYAVFALIAGPLSDGWNRKKVMLCGMVCFSISTILCGFATGFWTMFLFRFLAGVSAAFTSPQVWAAIATLVPSQKVIKAMGIATAGLAVSQALGVPIGSRLAVHHWSHPFLVIGACSMMLALFIFFVLPDLKPAQAPDRKTSIFKRYVLC
jgi:predicted MFS family arabinose efflux permease